jgi:hypothetical protein
VTEIPPFIVLALPRSRTAWLSKFLTYGPWVCGHDQARYFRSLNDAKLWFKQPFIGSAETIGPAFWRLIETYLPECRVLIVRRPVGEVVESIGKKQIAGIELPRVMQNLRKLDQKLDQAESRLRNVISINFDELADPDICSIVFQHCLTLPFDFAWWTYWNQVNVQIDFSALMRYMWIHYEPLTELAGSLRVTMLANLAKKRHVNRDDIVVGQEPWAKVWPDAEKLATQHSVQIGKESDRFGRTDIAGFQELDDKGRLQTTVARCNGRIVGYLVTIVAPDLANAGQWAATDTAFYADPAFPGVGRAIQVSSIAKLRERGTDTVHFRRGPHADPRLGKLWQRLGAVDDGQVFKMKLKDSAL